MNPDPGTYALILRLNRSRRIRIGCLGILELQPGYYIYVGSAFGPGGLRARTGRHRKKRGPRHWHIDYLKPWVDLTEIWFTHDPVKREHQWAEALLAEADSFTPLPGFGSSDCKCPTHLVYSPSKPDPDSCLGALQSGVTAPVGKEIERRIGASGNKT